jgi:serine/threonine protein kinase
MSQALTDATHHAPQLCGTDSAMRSTRTCHRPQLFELPLLSKINLPHQPYNNLSTKLPALSKHGLDLLNQMLTYDPDKRITARQALSHRYFQELPLPAAHSLMPTFPLHAGHLPAPTTTTATTTTSSSSSTAESSRKYVPAIVSLPFKQCNGTHLVYTPENEPSTCTLPPTPNDRNVQAIHTIDRVPVRDALRADTAV